MTTGSVICKAYELVVDQRLIIEKDVDFAKNKIQSLFDSCGYDNVLTTLDYYTKIIDGANSIIFNYMDDAQKKRLLIDIHIAYLLLLAQEQYEIDYQKKENSKYYLDKRIECERLLNSIQGSKSNDFFVFVDNHLTIKNTIPNYLTTQSVTKNIIDLMNSVNAQRLYGIWASSLISAALSLIPSDFFHTQSALNIIDTYSFYSGILSWALYYMRFSIHLFLFLKNTIKGSWLTEDDKKSTYWNLSGYERLKIQWNKRKFELLNDFVWATGNLICYFWLIGSGTLGHLGSVLTIVLLAFDVLLCIWAYFEKLYSYRKELGSFIEAIDASEGNDYLLTALNKAKEQCERNWKYEKYKLYNDIFYAVVLLAAFTLMTLPFLSLTAPSLLFISLTGTVFCFAFTVLHDAISDIIDMYKNEEFNKDIHIIRSVFLSLLTPIVTLSSLIFLPLGSALIVLCAYAAFSIALKSIMDDKIQKESTVDTDPTTDDPQLAPGKNDVNGTRGKTQKSNIYKFYSDKKSSFSKQEMLTTDYINDDTKNKTYLI